MTVKLAPNGFTPTGIGNGKVQAVVVNTVPIFCRNVVTKRVLVAVNGDFGITRSTRSKVHKHWIVAATGVFVAVKMCAVKRIFAVEIAPALFSAANHNFGKRGFIILYGFIYLVGGCAVRGADNSRDFGGIKPVFKIVRLQLICSRNCHRAEFMKRQHTIPELIMPF